MKVLKVRNAHSALYDAVGTLRTYGYERDSRAGMTLVMSEPVTTNYTRPTERVVFWPDRDANPYFHFMEGLWMLGGRRDVAWISQFNSNISQFSDDGEEFHGAYGHRWISHFQGLVEPVSGDYELWPINQLSVVAQLFRENPDDRRCVVAMWDPSEDLGRTGKDFPCNTHIYFRVDREGRLGMTVCCRSNDIIWGAYGANAVHMSMLQEVMAAWIGVPVGEYWQVSNDWHAYVEVFEQTESIMLRDFYEPYGSNLVQPFPMVNGPIEEWLSDLQVFLTEGSVIGFRDQFFRKVVTPMHMSWQAWKNNTPKKIRLQEAKIHADSIAATDWRLACLEWLERRA